MINTKLVLLKILCPDLQKNIVKIKLETDGHIIALVGKSHDFPDYYKKVACCRIDNVITLLTFLEKFNPHVLIIGNGFWDMSNEPEWFDTINILDIVYQIMNEKRKVLKKRTLQIPTIKLGGNLEPNSKERHEIYEKRQQLKQKYSSTLVETECLKCKVLIEKAYQKSLVDTQQSFAIVGED